MLDFDIAARTFLTPEEDPLPALLELLHGARRIIRVSAYAFTIAAVVNELKKAHRRGVDVRLILDESQSQGKAQQREIRRLRRAGIPLAIGRSEKGGIVHLKCLIVDDYLWAGSWNLSNQASRQDNDVLLVKFPPGYASKHLAKFERAWLRLTAVASGRKKVASGQQSVASCPLTPGH